MCVYVMPCGVSASLEAGWACGAGKPLIVYVPGLREPDLMVKMADKITDSLWEVCRTIRELSIYAVPKGSSEIKNPPIENKADILIEEERSRKGGL